MDDHTRSRFLESLQKNAVVERLCEERAVTSYEGLEALAEELGVPSDCVGLHRSLAELTLSAVASVLGPDDVLALAEPCRESWLRGALACGARFLDVGRDHTLVPQESGLRRALEDDVAHAVLIEHPAILGGGTLDLPDDHDPFIFVDQSGSVMPEVAVDSGVLHLGQTGGVAWVVGTPERLAKITLEPGVTPRAARDRVDVDTMAGSLETSGLLLVQPGTVALWARLPGVLGADLEEAFNEQGVEVRRRAHPSWREGVALVCPERDQLGPWLEAVRRTTRSFSDTK